MNVLFIVGPHAVGKTYYMDKILKEYEAFKFDTGPHMRQIFSEFNMNIDIGTWARMLEEMHGPNVTTDMLAQKFSEEYKGEPNVIITGFRQIDGIKHMIERIKPVKYKILYLDADLELLKSNYESRVRKQVEQSDFERYIAAENEGGLGNLKKYVLENQGECQYFFKSSNDDFAEIELFGKKKFHLQSPNLEID